MEAHPCVTLWMNKQWSLTTREEFSAVFRHGRVFHGSMVVVRVLANAQEVSRLGLVVGKRVGGAVERNRAKRRIRHIADVRALMPGWDLVIIARSGIRSAQYRDLERELRQLLGKAGVSGADNAGNDRFDQVVSKNHL